MSTRDEHQGERRRGERRHGDRRMADRRAIAQRRHKLDAPRDADDAQNRRPDYRGPRESFTVRTEPEHLDVYARVAGLFGVSRNDLIAWLLSDVMGLTWRTKAPDVLIAVHRLPELVEALDAGMPDDQLDALVEDIKSEGVLARTA
ncbi:hypothetical protein ACFXGA_26990 [Actinosynnema sp. NPDC059335]|uniref:hypothetical protein n=1 Tax=Actinosynnema sp. NPDC059335 TaxID=3346804 RepID=UPI003671673C